VGTLSESEDYLLTAVFEVEPIKATALKAHFARVSKVDGLAATIERQMGSPLLSQPAVDRLWRLPRIDEALQFLRSVELIETRGCSNLLVVSLACDTAQMARLSSANKINATLNQKIFKSLSVEPVVQFSTDGVVCSTSVESVAADYLAKDSWLHLPGNSESTFFLGQLCRQIAIRVALEKALLNRAVKPSRSHLAMFMATPISGSRLRKLRVELLADRSLYKVAYLDLRTELNLPNSRAEVMENSRHWWLVLGGWAAVFASITGIVALIYTKH